MNNKVYGTDDLCRFCEEEEETFEHLINDCPCLYLDRCDLIQNQPITNSSNWEPRTLLKFAKIETFKHASFSPRTPLLQKSAPQFSHPLARILVCLFAVPIVTLSYLEDLINCSNFDLIFQQYARCRFVFFNLFRHCFSKSASQLTRGYKGVQGTANKHTRIRAIIVTHT